AARVIVLPPQVVFEQLSANARSRNFDSASFESALVSAASANLGARKYALAAPEGLRSPGAADWLKQLQPLASRLARGAINDDAQNILSQFETLPDNYLLLVQFMRVKQGPGGSWNPYSGAIASGMSSTLLQAALISTRTGQVMWKNEVLERSEFSANSPRFAKSVDLLYSTLVAQGANQ
ncbi:MAG: hypothetical protein WBX18_11410, partial [Terracidiphilus sp.]